MAVHTPLRGLRCFCVAAECLSFKDTARQLYLTPSAVSHQIKQLETRQRRQSDPRSPGNAARYRSDLKGR